jgi:hypothetical protein
MGGCAFYASIRFAMFFPMFSIQWPCAVSFAKMLKPEGEDGKATSPAAVGLEETVWLANWHHHQNK